jgi:flagellar export protein FliJ
MKKFTWPLQRVLDIKEKQEKAAVTELFNLKEMVKQKEYEIDAEQTKLLKTLSQAKDQIKQGNIIGHEMLLKFSAANDKFIKTLKQRVGELEIKVKTKKKELLDLRRFKQGLEKLKTKACEKFNAKQQKIEQYQLDEIATVSFTRKAAAEKKYCDC